MGVPSLEHQTLLSNHNLNTKKKNNNKIRISQQYNILIKSPT